MKENGGFYLPDGSIHKVKPPEDLRDRILKEKKPIDIDQLAGEIGVGVDLVGLAIDELKEEGYGIGKEGETVYRSKTHSEGSFLDLSDIDRHLHFGIVSDTHLASKKERLDALNKMYDIFESEGVGTVFHIGDLTDGWGVYRGQEFEVKYFGQDEQIDYTVEKYPKKDKITTYFITGNHDLRQYEKGGVDPGVPIGQRRKDMCYLGQINATVLFPNGIEAELLHPGGTIAYALSYKAQRHINNLSPEDVPDMLIFGHYHTTFHMHYRNVNFIQAACFKDAGLFEKRLGLNPTIGGWMVDATISPNSDTISRFKPELFRF